MEILIDANNETDQKKLIENTVLSIDKVPDNSFFKAFFFFKNNKDDTDEENLVNIKILKFNNHYYYVNNDKFEKVDLNKLDHKYEMFIMLLTNITAQDLGDFEKSYMTFFQSYHDKMIEQVTRKIGEYEVTDQDIQNFASFGIQYLPVKGACYFMKAATRIDHDDVQYAISFNESDQQDHKLKSIAHHVDHFEQIKQRHHDIVKYVYDFLKNKEGIGDLWAMPGGGAQIQVFFGNTTGYVGILYLDMYTPKENKGRKGKFTLVPNFAKNNHYFKDFDHPKIKVRKA